MDNKEVIVNAGNTVINGKAKFENFYCIFIIDKFFI